MIKNINNFTICLLLFSMMQVNANAISRGESVTIDAQTKSVKEVFDEIQEKSSYRFFYSDDLIDLINNGRIDPVNLCACAGCHGPTHGNGGA